MHIKRFRGKTSKEALKEVKEAFGDDAVILSTKRLNGFVEVLAAIDFDVERIESGIVDGTAIKSDLADLKEELFNLKSLLASIVTEKAVRQIAGLGDGAFKLYEELVEKGFHKRLAQGLIRAAVLSSGGETNLKEGCYKVLKEKIALCNPLTGEEETKLLALVGPTGAGKTTTIAKLAGLLALRHKKKVGLISIDNERRGANEALKAYIKDFGISVDTPSTKEDFNKVVWRHKNKDVVLIDTPGRNPKDCEGIIKLKGMLNGGLPIKTGLVLSVTSGYENLFDSCKGFGILPLDYLVFTKIDEACSFGSIINTFALIKKPIAYLCNGQRIPYDVAVASHKLLGNLLLGG